MDCPIRRVAALLSALVRSCARAQFLEANPQVSLFPFFRLVSGNEVLLLRDNKTFERIFLFKSTFPFTCRLGSQTRPGIAAVFSFVCFKQQIGDQKNLCAAGLGHRLKVCHKGCVTSFVFFFR